VRQAGEIARGYYNGTFKTWHKSHGNPVTDADIAVDNFLKQTLLAARPEYGWLSEETADDPARLSRRRVFVVDPIDGTYGFVKHRPQFTIVAAVVENGRPIAGAIYNPITDEYVRSRERSRRLAKWCPEPRVIACRSRKHPSSDGEEASRRTGWRVPWPASITAETRASAAYRMALVATGEFDATLSLTQKADWDLAAGDLIVEEAGGPSKRSRWRNPYLQS
jgi:myo-inositol-1(or 4)-monophosphatase